MDKPGKVLYTVSHMRQTADIDPAKLKVYEDLIEKKTPRETASLLAFGVPYTTLQKRLNRAGARRRYVLPESPETEETTK